MKTLWPSSARSLGRGVLQVTAVTSQQPNLISSLMLYSSLDASSANSNDPPADANSYRPFKVVDSVVTSKIQKELDLIEGLTEERAF